MTSTQHFTPAADVYAALVAALDTLTGRGYYATHTTALVDDPDNYECRCCTVVPAGQEDRYVLATGGAETTCTAALLAERGDEAISWRGDAAEIVDVLRSHGLDATWDGDPDKCVMVAVSESQRHLVADRYWDEIRSHAEQDDDDEWGSDLDEDDD